MRWLWLRSMIERRGRPLSEGGIEPERRLKERSSSSSAWSTERKDDTGAHLCLPLLQRLGRERLEQTLSRTQMGRESSKALALGCIKDLLELVCSRSARSLASSGTPPYASSHHLRVTGSGPSGATLHADSSSEDDTTSQTHRRATTNTNPILSRSVGYGTILIGSVGLPFQTKAFMEVHTAGFSRRDLLQDTGPKALEANPYGLWLGWIMAAIYMGGRLPQIYLNIKRGSVEGLNPLMFMFAVTANATYVGSILVRSMEWEKIQANAPWLLDAMVCVLLDLFILAQYSYYKFIQRRAASYEDDFGSYIEAKRPLI